MKRTCTLCLLTALLLCTFLPVSSSAASAPPSPDIPTLSWSDFAAVIPEEEWHGRFYRFWTEPVCLWIPPSFGDYSSEDEMDNFKETFVNGFCMMLLTLEGVSQYDATDLPENAAPCLINGIPAILYEQPYAFTDEVVMLHALYRISEDSLLHLQFCPNLDGTDYDRFQQLALGVISSVQPHSPEKMNPADSA